MKKEYIILIADRNPNVRKLLKRELENEGYLIRMAKNSREVLYWSYHHEFADILILDPDLPGFEEFPEIQKLKNRIPPLPIVIHALQSDYSKKFYNSNLLFFVEKSRESIKYLKQVIADILYKSINMHKKIMSKNISPDQ